MQPLASKRLAPKLHSSRGSEGSANVSTTEVVWYFPQKLPDLTFTLSFSQGLPHEGVHVASPRDATALTSVAKCLLNLVQPEITLPRLTLMLIPPPYTLIPVSLPCSLTGDQALPAISYARLFAPVRSSMARWGGGMYLLVEGSWLLSTACLHSTGTGTAETLGAARAEGREGRTGMCMQPIPLLQGFQYVLKGASMLCPSFCPPHLLFLDNPIERLAYEWEQILCPGRVLYAI